MKPSSKMSTTQQKLNQASSPTQQKVKSQLNTLLLKQKSPSQYTIQSPTVSPTQISLPKALYPHKNSSIDLTKLASLMKQQQGKSPMHQEVSQVFFFSQTLPAKQEQPSMTQLIAKARALASQAKQGPIHIRNDSAAIRKDTGGQQQVIQKQNFINLKEISLNSPKPESGAPQPINKSAFSFEYVIGIGGFGKVWRVDLKRTGQAYAMKEMAKALVITKKSVNSVMNERMLLSKLKHPFLINMYYAFQDRENLYLVMDYMRGGDLRYHIGRMRRFNEEQTSKHLAKSKLEFFVASIYIGLDYLHENKIIHRDIKPENLVLDDKGFVHITDLGIAREMKPENSQDTSGTPGYMAPEVMCRQNHTYAVDYYALGVIAYEFMLGRVSFELNQQRPYVGRSRQEIRDQILARQVQVKQNEIPPGWSLEAVDCINKLLQRKPANRLGFNGSAELKLHPWFKNFPWSKLQNRELKAPFVPNQSDDNFDSRQIVIEDEENAELIQQNQMLLREPNVQQQFIGYEFCISTQNGSSTGDSSKQSRTLSSQGQDRIFLFDQQQK